VVIDAERSSKRQHKAEEGEGGGKPKKSAHSRRRSRHEKAAEVA
jgi:hypothetical protein